MSQPEQQQQQEQDLKSVNFNIDSLHFIKAMSPAMLAHCSKENIAFLQCKSDKGEDPEACLTEAVDCRRCAFKLAGDLLNENNGCTKVFLPYLQCMYRRRGDWNGCYDQRLVFEACASKNLGIQFRQPVKPYYSNSKDL